jgi:hypothetical protein
MEYSRGISLLLLASCAGMDGDERKVVPVAVGSGVT